EKKRLKLIGKKELAPKEQQAYNLFLDGVKSKEACKKMGYRSVNGYLNVLKRAKDKIKLNKLNNEKNDDEYASKITNRTSISQNP
ncbi:unnamed protein product, partial [marine sediment metagenome]